MKNLFTTLSLLTVLVSAPSFARSIECNLNDTELFNIELPASRNGNMVTTQNMPEHKDLKFVVGAVINANETKFSMVVLVKRTQTTLTLESVDNKTSLKVDDGIQDETEEAKIACILR